MRSCCRCGHSVWFNGITLAAIAGLHVEFWCLEYNHEVNGGRYDAQIGLRGPGKDRWTVISAHGGS